MENFKYIDISNLEEIPFDDSVEESELCQFLAMQHDMEYQNYLSIDTLED